MTLLRHPVVITSLEEDFRRIGLIREEAHDEYEAPQDTDESEDTEEPEDDSEVDEACASSKKKGKKKMPAMEADSDEDEDEDEDEAMAEAVAFHESATTMWREFGEAGVETLEMDSGDMDELESMAESITELPVESIGETLEDEDEGDEDDEDEHEATNAFESVAEAMRAIESILDEDARPTSSLEEATPAFANLALISEKLYGFFTETSEVQEDAEYAEIAEAYKQIAQYAAAIVDALQTEDEDTINFDALTETFNDYLGTVLQGLETYAILREADEGDEDEDEDEGEEQDEGNE